MEYSAFQDRFHLPDVLAHWPWVRSINPLYEEVRDESAAWVESFKLFSEKAQKAFNRCDFSLLAALGYPDFDKDRLRTCADVMNFFFIFDAFSDVEDEVGVRAQRDIIMDALKNPHKPRPEGESILGEITRQMWARALPTAT
ncbi:hypothetical protein EW146_g9336, partial [Bondarzewia mesenterica]